RRADRRAHPRRDATRLQLQTLTASVDPGTALVVPLLLLGAAADHREAPVPALQLALDPPGAEAEPGAAGVDDPAPRVEQRRDHAHELGEDLRRRSDQRVEREDAEGDRDQL